MDVYLNWIAGQWKQGSSGQWEDNRNPARPSELLGKATRSSQTDVERAIDAALAIQGEWSRMPRPIRGALLAKTAQILKNRTETMAKTLSREVGRNLNESRTEVLRASQSLEALASEGRRPHGALLPSERPGRTVSSQRVPLGTVGVIAPWASPMAIAARKIGAALIEGNTVVFKPSSLAPATAAALVRAFEEAGIPAGVLNLVNGGALIGNALVQDKRLKAVAFAGSLAQGRSIQEQLVRRGDRAQVEAASRAAAWVSADADLDASSSLIAASAISSAGQSWSSIGTVWVDRPVAGAFAERLMEKLKTVRVGDGIQDPAAMGPLADEAQAKRVRDWFEEVRRDGGRVSMGGESLAKSGAISGSGVGESATESGLFLTPALIDEVRTGMACLKEIPYGPVIAWIPVEGFDEAARAAQLSSANLPLRHLSVFSKDPAMAQRAMTVCDADFVHWNTAPAELDCGTETDLAFFSKVKVIASG